MNKNHIGVGHPKLDASQVIIIRDSYWYKNKTYKELSIDFKVSVRTIFDIVNYKTWRDLEQPKYLTKTDKLINILNEHKGQLISVDFVIGLIKSIN